MKGRKLCSTANQSKDYVLMDTIVTSRPETGEPFARTPHRVRSRLFAAAVATGAIIDTDASKRSPLLTDAVVMPFANFALLGTGCARPLKFEEGEEIARVTGLDVLLMRFDPDRGVSFDVFDHRSTHWRCNHVAWRRRDGDLWLIPQASFGEFIRVGAWGLEYETEPPFASGEERYAGIIRAIEIPSFEGSL